MANEQEMAEFIYSRIADVDSMGALPESIIPVIKAAIIEFNSRDQQMDANVEETE